MFLALYQYGIPVWDYGTSAGSDVIIWGNWVRDNQKLLVLVFATFWQPKIILN